MSYTLTKVAEIPQKEKVGLQINVYSEVDRSGVVVVKTDTGHETEFYHKESTFTYIVLEGEGTFYLDDEVVPVVAGDQLTIDPMTRIYYRGTLRLALLTTPPWREENEVTTKEKAW